MNKAFTGTLCLSDLSEAFKSKNSAFWKSKKGKDYVNIKIWVSEEADQYGNTLSLQLDTAKGEAKAYIGNAKPLVAKEAVVATVNTDDGSDLPF